MHISCEKCGTTYVLDEKLIPASGAPVQCTKCSHVFVARAPEPAKPAAAPNTTMMFGAVPAPSTAPAATNQTMMFGVPGVGGAPVPEAPPATVNPNKTVMFGVPGAAPASPSSTMMFGAPGAAANAPAAPAKPVFGAPGAAPSNPNSTMMFGAPAAAGSPAATPNSTMMFGAPATAGSAPQSPNSTMMFGAPSVGSPPANPNSTMMFGAPAAATAPAPAKTAMFGATHVPAPAAPVGATNQTMMFGVPGASPAPAAPSVPAPANPNKTVMFGVPGSGAAPVPAPSQAASQTAGRTMMFGIPADGQGLTPIEPGLPQRVPESTVRIAPGELEDFLSQQGVQSPTEARHQKTQMFAMSDSQQAGPSPEKESVESRHQKTQMFAMSDVEPGKPDPSMLETLRPDGSPPARGSDAGRGTMIFGVGKSEPVAVPFSAQGPMATQAGRAPVDLSSTTVPNLAPVEPLKPMKPQRPRPVQSAPASSAVDDPAEALAAANRRRNRVALGVFLFALLAALGLVGWKLFGHKLLGASVPEAAVSAVFQSLDSLKQEDAASRASSIATLSANAKLYPDYLEGHAALVLALALESDDQQFRAKLVELQYEARNAAIVKFNNTRAPADWQARAKAAHDDALALNKAYDGLKNTCQELSSKLAEAERALIAAGTRNPPSGPAQLAYWRAQGMYQAHANSPEALKQVELFRAQSPQPDGWVEMVTAQYAIWPKTPESALVDAGKALTDLVARDSSYVRAVLLQGRLNFRLATGSETLGDRPKAAEYWKAALADFEKVKALKPEHVVATEAAEWIKRERLATAPE